LGSDGLARPCGRAEGPFAEYPMASLVLHINRGAIHHSAEVALLRVSTCGWAKLDRAPSGSRSHLLHADATHSKRSKEPDIAVHNVRPCR
jgi:hypothetical protein